MMHKGLRVYFLFLNMSGMTFGAFRDVNYGHSADVLLRFGGYGLISSEKPAQLIREFDPQSKHLFVLSYLESGEREPGFICSSSADVNLCEDHERLCDLTHLRWMGF